MTSLTADPRELRYYAHAAKLFGICFLCVCFAAACLWILSMPEHRSPSDIIIGGMGIIFSSGGAIVIMFRLLRNTLSRQPVMVINASGFEFPSPMYHARPIAWDDVVDITIGRQGLQRGVVFYYLIITDMNPEERVRSRIARLAARWYPALSDDDTLLPLGLIFFRGSEARGHELLSQIEREFAQEIEKYEVLLSDDVLPI